MDVSRDYYRASIQQLVERGAQAIILGCTEIMLLVGAADSSVPILDTTQLHALAAVDFALSSAPLTAEKQAKTAGVTDGQRSQRSADSFGEGLASASRRRHLTNNGRYSSGSRSSIRASTIASRTITRLSNLAPVGARKS